MWERRVEFDLLTIWFELTSRSRCRSSIALADGLVVTQSSNSAESNELVGKRET
jgi:hypothetical protein